MQYKWYFCRYIVAALNLYLDVINIFIYILACIGGRN